jgi:hypothetical protein
MVSHHVPHWVSFAGEAGMHPRAAGDASRGRPAAHLELDGEAVNRASELAKEVVSGWRDPVLRDQHGYQHEHRAIVQASPNPCRSKGWDHRSLHLLFH